MKRKTTPAERARREEAQRNAAWVRDLAERAEARLPPERRRPPGASNSDWLRQLAQKGKAELDERAPSDA